MRATAFDPLSISPAFWERLDVRQARHRRPFLTAPRRPLRRKHLRDPSLRAEARPGTRAANLRSLTRHLSGGRGDWTPTLVIDVDGVCGTEQA